MITIISDREKKMEKYKGFSLIELMIVVAIVAIIVTVAVPSYQDSLKKSKRSDAKAALLNVQMAQEKYRSNNPSYSTLANIGVTTSSPDGYYTIALVGTPNGTTFVATATPTGSQTGDSCGTFAVNQSGELTTGSYASSDCWNN